MPTPSTLTQLITGMARLCRQDIGHRHDKTDLDTLARWRDQNGSKLGRCLNCEREINRSP